MPVKLLESYLCEYFVSSCESVCQHVGELQEHAHFRTEKQLFQLWHLLICKPKPVATEM